MTKIDIFSGFLGAGKTTLIKKLIAEAYQGEKVVLIDVAEFVLNKNNLFALIGLCDQLFNQSGFSRAEKT